MDISNYYSLSSKFSSSTAQAEPVNADLFMKAYNRLLRGEFSDIELPVKFKLVSGKKFEDILDTGTESLYLISDKLKGLLESEKFTGWFAFEIDLSGKDDAKITGYHGLAITGRCGAIDQNKGEIIEKKFENGYVSHYRKGLYIGLDRWDGSDLFYPDGSSFLITTGKVSDTLKKHKITNVVFQNLGEIELMMV